MYDDFDAAGLESHRTETLSRQVQIDFNATARQTMDIVHYARSLVEGDSKCELASVLRTELDNLPSRYHEWWTNIGSPTKNDMELASWKTRHGLYTVRVCQVVKNILDNLPPTTAKSETQDELEEPPSSVLNIGSIPSISRSTSQRFGTLGSEFVPTPIDPTAPSEEFLGPPPSPL